jgi:WD40 repeat protein
MSTLQAWLLCVCIAMFAGAAPGNAQDGIKGGKEVAVFKTIWDVRCVALSRDGQHLYSVNYGGYSGDDFIFVIDIRSGKTERFSGRSRLSSIAVSPDGKRIAVGGAKGVSVYDAGTQKEIHWIRDTERPQYIRSMAFSPDGKRLVSGDGGPNPWHGGKPEGIVKVHDAETGKETLKLKGHAWYVTSVAFSSDGKRIVTGSADYTVRVWNSETGAELVVFKGHTCVVNAVAISHDGKRIVSAGGVRRQDDPQYDAKKEGNGRGEVKVWDANTGKELLDLKGRNYEVRSVAIDPGGKYIAAVGQDETVSLWDAVTGRPTATLKGTHAMNTVIFSHDGKRIITGEDYSKVRIWARGE